MKTIEKDILERLAVLNPIEIELYDESHRHIGHAGSKLGGHYQLLIVSDTFIGQSQLLRQKGIYALLKDLFHSKIHALSIKALTADELS